MYKEKLSSGSTVKKFDNLLKNNESMLVEEEIKIRIDNTTYYIHLIIDKPNNNYTEVCRNPISASDLKKCFKMYFSDPLHGKPIDEITNEKLINISIPAYHFLLYFRKSLQKKILEKEVQRDDIIYFDIPITIHAQTSDDMDYEWDGNRYGDTSTFYVIGYKIGYIFTSSINY